MSPPGPIEDHDRGLAADLRRRTLLGLIAGAGIATVAGCATSGGSGAATASTTSAATSAASQIALPKDVCDGVYATDGYATSVRNLSAVSLDTDNVFRDGWSSQLGTITGSVDSGLAVALAVPVSA
jgi:hypothetical protein